MRKPELAAKLAAAVEVATTLFERNRCDTDIRGFTLSYTGEEQWFARNGEEWQKCSTPGEVIRRAIRELTKGAA